MTTATKPTDAAMRLVEHRGLARPGQSREGGVMEPDNEILYKCIDRLILASSIAFSAADSLDDKLRFERLRRKLQDMQREARLMFYEIEDAIKTAERVSP